MLIVIVFFFLYTIVFFIPLGTSARSTLLSNLEKMSVILGNFATASRAVAASGKGLLDAFLEKATELQLELSDCRGQSYDNGANMKGKHSGVQARMLDINPKAVYVPCANHTLNLVVVDSAN